MDFLIKIIWLSSQTKPGRQRAVSISNRCEIQGHLRFDLQNSGFGIPLSVEIFRGDCRRLMERDICLIADDSFGPAGKLVETTCPSK
jgi:hypothetical protein